MSRTKRLAVTLLIVAAGSVASWVCQRGRLQQLGRRGRSAPWRCCRQRVHVVNGVL